LSRLSEEGKLDLNKMHKSSDKRFSIILARPVNKKDIPDELWRKTESIKVNRFRKECIPFYLTDWENIKIDKFVVNNTCAIPINFITNMTEEFSKIIGALCADGHITTKSKADYIIQLADGDRTAVFAFQRWIKNTFGIEYKVKKDYTTNCWRIDINNKIIGRYLVDIIGFPTGKKSATIRIPKIIKESNAKVQKAFIIGVMTFDGGVNVNGNIEFLIRSKQFYCDIVKILKNLDMNAHYKETRDKNGFWRFHVCRSDQEYNKWLHFFENGTEKWEKINDNIHGFKRIPSSENEALEVFGQVFPPKSGNIVSLSDFFKYIKNVGNCSIEYLAGNLNIDKTTTNKYRRILRDCNIIHEKGVIGRKHKIEIIFNRKINKWRVPKRSYDQLYRNRS